ncbi:MAG: hypothetical protein CVV27_09080 [Candidatus Melainabacteria bacterium HGW-Melainabacteria-1]|nr:MAG: hypothetical protein CVV27_09080 [Candidatus Melainabacteria bacterium HGW-Melainabacteria-1]
MTQQKGKRKRYPLSQLAQPLNDHVNDRVNDRVNEQIGKPASEQAIQSKANDAEESGAGRSMSEMLEAIFLGYHPPSFATRLSLLDDGLPLPQVFAWEADVDDPVLSQLNSEETRTLKGFEQITFQGRKSSKYLQAMQALQAAHPESEYLALILINYLQRWDQAQYQELETQLADAHPDWLLLRFTHASGLLLDTDPTDPDPKAIARFLAVMNDRFELHEQLERQPTVPLSETLVMSFYTATAAYYILTDRFARACYSLNLAAAAGAENLLPLMSQLLMRVLDQDQLEGLKTFLEPLRQEREASWSEAD